MTVDPAIVRPPGPWTHRMVAANGGRFHVAVTGPDDADAPLVVLLHGFPQLWWAWRHQLVALGEAGFRAAAMDLRGYGASDKPPGAYDLPTLTADVAGVIRSLGASSAVVVGQGLGGQVAWTLPSLDARAVRAIGVLGAPHPLHLVAAGRAAAPTRTLLRLAQFQVPWFPERAMTRGDLVARLLDAWSAPGWSCPDVDLYTQAARLPFAAHSQMEQLRWLVRSRPRPDGRRFLELVEQPVSVPVLSLHGRLDGNLPPRACRRDGAMVSASYRRVLVDGAGHFLPEEAPEEVTQLLLTWLRSLPLD
ncbi:MAG TPA: alpha/beta hydrolase [Actinotalea caeni]|uniref:alpha/beta fold hydrolase n=1 Tax=Actinotalea caeni TaxID=1348467 RepID=UPI002B4AD2DD|nr:alpha/beta hydrolase [Actinotalea caeni]HLV57173.1 alpha/beta hydrolase [Actinotalea caeni]